MFKTLGIQILSEHLTILNEPRILNKKFDYLGATGPPRGGQKSQGGKGAGAAIGGLGNSWAREMGVYRAKTVGIHCFFEPPRRRDFKQGNEPNGLLLLLTKKELLPPLNQWNIDVFGACKIWEL